LREGEGEGEGELCPLIKTPPSNYCYSVEINSLKIPDFLKYCGKEFRNCKFYADHIKKEHGRSNVKKYLSVY